MIQNHQELKATLNRIERFQKQVEKLQQVETNPRNYELSAGGFLADIDRMNLEVAEYLSDHSSELIKSIVNTVHLKPDDVLFYSSTEHEWNPSLQAMSLSNRTAIWRESPQPITRRHRPTTNASKTIAA